MYRDGVFLVGNRMYMYTVLDRPVMTKVVTHKPITRKPTMWVGLGQNHLDYKVFNTMDDCINDLRRIDQELGK